MSTVPVSALVRCDDFVKRAVAYLELFKPKRFNQGRGDADLSWKKIEKWL